MYNGFYRELDEMHSEALQNADFGFLENVTVGEWFNLYDFLHGHCDEFAAALSDFYGYSIEYVLNNANVLVHAYCVSVVNGQKTYIDARGITTDAELFFAEFADFCTFHKETGGLYDLTGECPVASYKSTYEMYNDDNRIPNQDKDLVQFFKDNNSYYDIKLFAKENHIRNWGADNCEITIDDRIAEAKNKVEPTPVSKSTFEIEK